MSEFIFKLTNEKFYEKNRSSFPTNLSEILKTLSSKTFTFKNDNPTTRLKVIDAVND